MGNFYDPSVNGGIGFYGNPFDKNGTTIYTEKYTINKSRNAEYGKYDYQIIRLYW